MEYGLVALWLVAYLALGLAALPVAAVLFRRLPDRGAGVALPLALVVVTVPAYWVGRLAFGWPALLVGLAVLVGAGVAVTRRFDATPNWTAVGDTALVFAAAFGFMIAIRAVDPAVHPLYGEKMLDFGLLKSLLRAPVLPPEDMWFAGEPVKYYYGGHLIAALLATLTDTAGRYAYNLALAGFYAMLVTAAFGVGSALGRARGASRRGAGLASAFFVGLASNLSTPARALGGVLPPSLVTSIAPQEAGDVASGLASFSYWPASRTMAANVITEFPLFAWLNGDLHAHMTSTPFTLLVVALLVAYYRTPESELRRRRLLVFGCVPVVGGLIAVVNTWSFPTVGGLTALALLFAPADPTTLLPEPAGRRLRAVADGTAVAVDGGTATADDRGWADRALRRTERVTRHEVVRAASAALGAAAVLAVGFVLVLPFFTGAASTREVAVWDGARRSSLGGLLLAHGGFLLVFAAYLRGRVAGWSDVDGRLVLVGLAALLVVGVAHGFAAFGLFVSLLVVAWVLLRRVADLVEATPDATAEGDPEPGTESAAAGPDVGFETLLVVAGAGLALLVEVLYVVEEAGPGRFNTVFKTYAQVWILWGTAAGAMFATMVRERVTGPLAAATSGAAGSAGPASGSAGPASGSGPDDGASGLSGGDDGPSPVAGVLAVLLVLSLSLYGGLALSNHFAGETIYPDYQRVDDPTLDATAFVAEGHPEEAAAIQWLDEREGRPTIVTAAPGGYRWDADAGKGSSAPASLTGLPTVAGWFHERGYRGSEVFAERVADVRTIYTGSDTKRACTLARYDVEYVYVGPAERARYGSVAGDFGGVPGVGEPMRFDEVLIFPVDGAALTDGTDC